MFEQSALGVKKHSRKITLFFGKLMMFVAAYILSEFNGAVRGIIHLICLANNQRARGPNKNKFKRLGFQMEFRDRTAGARTVQA